MALLPNWTIAVAGTGQDQLADNEYQEDKTSGKESYSTGNSSANRVLVCNWAVRPDFLNDLLGWSYLDGSNVIHRTIPDEHPDIANFFAQDASLEGKGVLGRDSNTQVLAWTTAVVQANYKPVPYNVLDDSEIDSEQDRYTSRTYAFSSDYLTIQGNMKWVTRPTHDALAAQPGMITGAMSMQYTWHEVPGKADNPFVVPNLENINACLGKVNSVAFDPNGGDYAEGTVLFVGVDPKMITPKLTDNVFYWDITFSFLYRDNGDGIGGETAGHQYIYDTANSRWDLVTTDGTSGGPRIYQTADLNSLWVIT